MIKFIIIGLLCNSQGCYWAQVETDPIVYDSYQSCIAKAYDWKAKTAMYHSMACMVKP